MSDPAEKVSAGSVAWLIERLHKLPQERTVMCQVIGTDGSAWNMQFEFLNVERSDWMVQLRVSHPDLHTLPTEAFTATHPSADERQRVMELKRLTDVHRGWCNYCQGGESACMNAPEGGCSLRDYLRALSSAPKGG